MQNYNSHPTETTSLKAFFFKNSVQQLRDQFYLILSTNLLKSPMIGPDCVSSSSNTYNMYTINDYGNIDQDSEYLKKSFKLKVS